MILYRCDRCGSETTPEKLFDIEVVYAPRDHDGGESLDNETREWVGQLCETCADALEAHALVQPATPVAASPIVLTPTARGFLRGEFIDNPIDGNACSIQVSSALLFDDADGGSSSYHLWLGVDDPKPRQFPGDGTGRDPLPENVHCTTRMHLSRATAASLIPLLQRYVEQGDLCEPEGTVVAAEPIGSSDSQAVLGAAIAEKVPRATPTLRQSDTGGDHYDGD